MIIWKGIGVSGGSSCEMLLENTPRLFLRLRRDLQANLPQPVHGERIHLVRDFRTDMAGNSVTLENSPHQLRFGIIPGLEDDAGTQESSRARPLAGHLWNAWHCSPPVEARQTSSLDDFRCLC